MCQHDSGEKCSCASADSGNRRRSVSDAGRQSSGRKMDYLLTSKKTAYEIGCGEYALVGVVNTTKSNAIPCVRSKANWDPIATGIIDKSLAYPSADKLNANSSPIGAASADGPSSSNVSTGAPRSSASVSRISSSSSTVLSSDPGSSDSTSTKILKLTPA
ncbi:hypothetical protein FB192DRAFT_1344013 [Mucor lusitanicus]|uniref:Uncharacterized protein n=2 Tax=Mucor circinelloides f. lusitanicus TaxID=29924 RepID=A0A162QAU5_MUCCL|nr:hypothetical protein FB192DRAFT_1344013 [Mucor lusitanicus]OAD00380.1 hypothetical protein MUCCIDRAFT_166162 [Mucor lusitanicus CBS 277.49]